MAARRGQARGLTGMRPARRVGGSPICPSFQTGPAHMTSLLTNASAITALQNLSATNKAMQQTQDRISTGMRVANASDNAAYWSIATTMRSDNSVMSAVKDALGMGSATVDVASAALKTTS